MEVKKCARCHRLRPLSLFEKFKSGRARATCNRCIQRDNYPAIDRINFPNPTSVQQPRMNENFNLAVPPPMLSPVNMSQRLPDPQVLAETNMDAGYMSSSSRERTYPSTPVASRKHTLLEQRCKEPKLNGLNSDAHILMPGLEAIASLQPDLGPLLSSLNESGSYVLLYIPCKMHHK